MLLRRHVWQKYRNGRDSGNGLPWYKSACNRDSTVESQHQHPHSGNVPVQTTTRVLSAQDVSSLYHNLTYFHGREMLHKQNIKRSFLGNARDEMNEKLLRCNFNGFFKISTWFWKFQSIIALKKSSIRSYISIRSLARGNSSDGRGWLENWRVVNFNAIDTYIYMGLFDPRMHARLAYIIR